MQPTWSYRQGEEVGASMSIDELRRLAESGRLKASGFVRNGQDAEWWPAGICEELRVAFTKSLPPPLPPAPPPPIPLEPKPMWPWVAGAAAVLGLPAVIVILLALLGGSARSTASESLPTEVIAGDPAIPDESFAAPPVTISGEDATEDLIQMMAEMTEDQQTAIGLHYLTTGQDFYGARIRITNRGNVSIWVRPENIRLHLQGDTVGVSSRRDRRFLQTTLLEPQRYVEGLVVYRAHREAGTAMRLGSGQVSYLLE